MQFNNPVFKPVENTSTYSQNSFRTEYVPTHQRAGTQKSDHQYDKIFSSETDLSSRMGDSILNDPYVRTFEINNVDASRALSITYNEQQKNYIRFGDDEQDTSLINMVNILQKSNYNVERITVGMQQLDSLFNRIADVSDSSIIKKQPNLTDAEIKKHMTMTIGEDELRDELRDQVFELPNKDNTALLDPKRTLPTQQTRFASSEPVSAPYGETNRQPQSWEPQKPEQFTKTQDLNSEYKWEPKVEQRWEPRQDIFNADYQLRPQVARYSEQVTDKKWEPAEDKKWQPLPEKSEKKWESVMNKWQYSGDKFQLAVGAKQQYNSDKKWEPGNYFEDQNQLSFEPSKGESKSSVAPYKGEQMLTCNQRMFDYTKPEHQSGSTRNSPQSQALSALTAVKYDMNPSVPLRNIPVTQNQAQAMVPSKQRMDPYRRFSQVEEKKFRFAQSPNYENSNQQPKQSPQNNYYVSQQADIDQFQPKSSGSGSHDNDRSSQPSTQTERVPKSPSERIVYQSPDQSSIVQSHNNSSQVEESNQFSYVSLPRYSKHNSTNQFEVLNVSTPTIQQQAERSYLRNSGINEKKTVKNSETCFPELAVETNLRHDIFVPLTSQPKVHYRTQENYYPNAQPRIELRTPPQSSPKSVGKPKIFEPTQEELFDQATQKVYQQRCRTRQPKWEKKKKEDPEMNVLCINCDELINMNSVDEHSKLCLAKTKPVKVTTQRELISELISELNRKLGVVRTTISKLTPPSSDRLAYLALIESINQIIDDNQNYQTINSSIVPLNKHLTVFSMRGDKESLYLTLLIQRAILLSEEKALKIQFIIQQQNTSLAQIDESGLFSELSVIEKMAQQERANLELWKQQHEMMVMVQVQDLANMKYLKKEYLQSDNEVLSQIRSDWDHRTTENRSQQPVTASLASDLHYQSDIDQVYNGPIDRPSLGSAPDQENKRIFYNLAVQAKLNLPHNHKGKNILIQDIYSKCLELKIPQTQWTAFIRKEIDNYKS